MIRKIFLFGLGLTLTLSFNLSTSMAQQVLLGNDADASVRVNAPGNRGQSTISDGTETEFGLQNPGSSQIRIGRFTSGDGINVAAVYVFELPNLGATSNPFATASLEFSLLSFDGTPDYNADLYGLDSRPNIGLDINGDPIFEVDATTDFYFGPADELELPNLLQDNILTPESSLGSNSSVDIAAYLNEQYDNGAGVGEAVFLRFSPDTIPTIQDNRIGYLIGTASNDTGGAPAINFTVNAVPEPSSALLLLIGATAYTSRRRRIC